MDSPPGFSWIEKPLLAAMGAPQDEDELAWVRRHGVEILLSLTEDPPPSRWVENAGLLLFHVPVVDLEAPSLGQLNLCLSAIRKAHEGQRGVAVHCGAGLGRTGVVLACYFVEHGLLPDAAISHVRRLRPGSIETPEQVHAVTAFYRSRLPHPD